MSDNKNSEIRRMAEENANKFLETRALRAAASAERKIRAASEAKKQANAAASAERKRRAASEAKKQANAAASAERKRRAAATAALRAAAARRAVSAERKKRAASEAKKQANAAASAARKNAAAEAGRARAAAKAKQTPQRAKTESAKRTPQRPKTGSAKRTPSPKSWNNNNNLNMENQLEQNQKNSDELEEWAEKNKTKTKIRNFEKILKNSKNEAKENTNINITKNNRDLAGKFNPEFQQALRTNNSTNNKRVVNVAVQAAKEKHPTLKWNKITEDIITPMVNEIKGFIAEGQLQKALRVIVPLIFTVYLNLTPRFMNSIIRRGIGSLSKYLPFMAPISNTSSAWWKRLHALIIYTTNPTKERAKYEIAMGPFPGNKYGRSFIGVITQFLTIAVTLMIAAIPIDDTGVSQKFFQIFLRLIQFSAPKVFDNVVAVAFEGTEQTAKLTGQALTAALKFATVGAGATIGGPVGAGAGALATTMVR